MRPADKKPVIPDKKDTRRIQRAKTRFVQSLKKLPNISAACELAGLSRSYAYQQREIDSLFRQQWDEALERATDMVEQKAYELALHGNPQLIQFLLKAHRKNVYADISRTEQEPLPSSQLPVAPVVNVIMQQTNETEELEKRFNVLPDS